MLASTASLEDLAFPGVILNTILHAPLFCRARLFEALLQAQPAFNLIFAPLDLHQKKCFFNLIAFKNAEDLWNVVERHNPTIPYERLVDVLTIFCSDDMIHKMFSFFDRQNPDFDYNTGVKTWFYKNTIAPIFIAADYGHSKVFKFLVEKGCSIFDRYSQDTNEEGVNIRACLDFALQRRPFYAHLQKNNHDIDDLAVEKRQSYFAILESIYKTIASQPQLVTLDRYYAAKANPLHCAISQKDFSLVLKMITLIKKYSAFINCTIDTLDEALQTPLMHALRSYQPQTHEHDSKIFEFLVAQGARLDVVDRHQTSAFFFLRPEHPVSFAHTLIDKAFSSSDSVYKQRFLEPISLPLVEKNNDPAHICHYGLFQGKTIAHHAAFLGHTCVLQKLLNHGVSFEDQDLLGFTPLFSYIGSQNPIDFELLKRIANSISDGGHNLFEIASGFFTASDLDFETQEIISQHVDYFRNFNVFELSIFFQRLDFVIYLIEKGALDAQAHLNRDSFFKIIINTIEDRRDPSCFCQKFLIPLFCYLKDHPQLHLGLFFDDLADIQYLVLKPRVYVSIIEFVDMAFPDFFFKHINTLVYQEAFNAFAAQKGSFPNESSLSWYQTFLKRWISYRKVHQQDLFSENHFEPRFILSLLDSKHHHIVEHLIQQASLQIKDKDRNIDHELYALEKTSFVEKMVLFFITSENPRLISVLINLVNSDAFSSFFEAPESMSQMLSWINQAYENIKDNKELMQYDIDLLYLCLVDHGLQNNRDFILNMSHLCDESGYWIERVLAKKSITKSTLLILIEKQWKKQIFSQLEIEIFIKLYKKIQSLHNKKNYAGVLSEIEWLLKKMIFDYSVSMVKSLNADQTDLHSVSMVKSLNADQTDLHNRTRRLVNSISVGLSWNDWHRNILFLASILDAEKIHLLALKDLEKEVFLSSDFSAFLEKVKPALLSEYQIWIERMKEPGLTQDLEMHSSSLDSPEKTLSNDTLLAIDDSFDSLADEQTWIPSYRREKKISKKNTTTSLSTRLVSVKNTECSFKKQKSPVVFQKPKSDLEISQQSPIQKDRLIFSTAMLASHCDFPSLEEAPAYCDQNEVVALPESKQTIVSDAGVSFMVDQVSPLSSLPSLFETQNVRRSGCILFADRDVGDATEERLNRLIDFTLDGLYKSLQNKQYQDVLDTWQHLKIYSKNQVPEKIVDVITLIKEGNIERAEQMIDEIVFQPLLLKQRYGKELRDHAYFYSDLARQHMQAYSRLRAQAEKHLALAKQAEIKALSLLKRKSDNPTNRVMHDDTARAEKESVLKKILGLTK